MTAAIIPRPTCLRHNDRSPNGGTDSRTIGAICVHGNFARIVGDEPAKAIVTQAIREYRYLTRRGQIGRLRRVADIVLSQYGIEPLSLSLLAHAYNTTFAVTGPDESRYVLHVLRPVDGALQDMQRRARVESEMWWLERVRVELKVAVPMPVRTPTGEVVVSVALEGIAPLLQCTLFRWLDGHQIRHRLTPGHLEAVGRLTACLHNHSAQLQIPSGFDRPVVDRADAQTEDDVALFLADHVSMHASDVVRSVFRRVRKAQSELGDGAETFGLIHADIHQNNYLFRGGEVRLIDFGDCGWGHYIYDLAVTLSELRDIPHYVALRAALLAGYRQERRFSQEHEALIDTFVMLREVQNLAWFVTARDGPSFVSRATEIGERVAALEGLLGTP